MAPVTEPVAADDGPRYRSPLRQAQAQATRSAVLIAAADSFARDGYLRTTMRAIATSAGVSVETVYAQGSKSGLLLAAVDRALAGDDEDAPLVERAPFAAALGEPSRAAMIESFVRALTAVGIRAGAVLVAFEDAARSDASLADLWSAAEDDRRTDYRRLVQAVAAAGPLATGWDVDTATDAVWATFTPRLAHTLLDVLDWPGERVVAWMSTAAIALLLPIDERPPT